MDNSTDIYDQHQIRVAEICHNSSKQALATLVRLFGDLDLAESTLQNAVLVAKKNWLQQGIPSNPQEWLISNAYLNAMHNLRFVDSTNDVNHIVGQRQNLAAHLIEISRSELRNDQLCLIFLCCHLDFNAETQLALTLRFVCRLPVNDIALALSIPQKVVAQRIMRAKVKIREQRIGYEIPISCFFLERLNSILQIIYLIFNAGYQPVPDKTKVQYDLAQEAIQLCRWLLGLLPDESEIQGLLALMLLHCARRSIQSSTENYLNLLYEHDRSRWNQNQINESRILIGEALNSSGFGPYTILAAITAVHAEAPDAERTDWYRIVGLYDLLMRIYPSPIVEFNRAVALAMLHGPETGLEMTASILQRGLLHDYHLMYAARADFYHRLGQESLAIETYAHALEFTQLESEKRLIECRMAELPRSK